MTAGPGVRLRMKLVVRNNAKACAFIFALSAVIMN
jgi:hypothetical protein